MSKVDDLRRACSSLYLEVPVTIADDVKAKAEAVIVEAEAPNLGLATTRELLAEISARIEMHHSLDYRTVDSE